MGFFSGLGKLGKGIGSIGKNLLPYGGLIGAGIDLFRNRGGRGARRSAKRAGESVPNVLTEAEGGIESDLLGRLSNPDLFKRPEVDLGEFSDPLAAASGGFLDRSNRAGESATGYYSDVLSGDPAKTAEMFAPEIGDISRTSQNSLDALKRFSPRGGERDRAMTLGHIQRSSDIGRTIAQARPKAADALSRLSYTQGGLGVQSGAAAGAIGGREAGLNLEGELTTNQQNLGANTAVLDTLRSKRGQRLGYAQGPAARNDESSRSLGRSLGDIGSLISQKVFNRGGGGGKKKKKGPKTAYDLPVQVYART